MELLSYLFDDYKPLSYHAHLQPPVTDPPANPAEAVQAVSTRKLDYNALTYVLADVKFKLSIKFCLYFHNFHVCLLVVRPYMPQCLRKILEPVTFMLYIIKPISVQNLVLLSAL